MKNQKSSYSSSSEKWKYTNINQFDSYDFNFKPIDKKINSNCKKNEILLYNGKFYKAGEDLINNKVLVYNINDAIKNNHNAIKQLLNTQSTINEKNQFKLKNISWDIGFFLYVPNHFTSTILITNIIDQGKQKNFLNSRNCIHIEKKSNCKIIYKEESNQSSCINNISEIYIEDDAKLEFANITNKKNSSEQIHHCIANLNTNAELIYHAIDISGKLIKNNYCINLNKPGSNCYFNGFNTANNKNHIDNYVEMHHNNKHTISNLNYHIISKDSAKSILFAKAIIKKDSSSCEAYQNNKNIILSKSALIHSNPQLEIYNDDVKCSHGSTTGQIDDEAVHYMRSRGINESDAKKLILHSFLNNIIKKVSIENLRSDLNNEIEKYLNNVN